MSKEMKEIKERLDSIERMIGGNCCIARRYCTQDRIQFDCEIDFGIKLRPLNPPTAEEANRLYYMEQKFKALLYSDIKTMEQRINNYLRCML